jgi:hypothetical protein
MASDYTVRWFSIHFRFMINQLYCRSTMYAPGKCYAQGFWIKICPRVDVKIILIYSNITSVIRCLLNITAVYNRFVLHDPLVWGR